MFGPTLDSVTGPGSWASYLAAHPQAYAPGLIAYVGEQQRIGPYRTRHPGGARHSGKDWMVTNTTDVELGGELTLRNIFGYSKSDTDSEQPQLGAPFVTILTANAAAGKSGNELHVRSLSEELQLQGTALDGKLNFIAGYYMQRQRSDTLWPQTYFDVSPIIPPAYVTNNFRIRNKTDALYAQATYALTDALKATAGIRYTWERVSIAQLPAATYTFGAPDQNRGFADPSWEVGLEYHATSNLFAYLKTRGSFRSGGFNGAAPPVNANATFGGNVFDSEHTQDIEGGLKYRGTLFGRPAHLNTAVFMQWIQDVQRVEFPDPDGPGGLASIAVTANVPSSRNLGLGSRGCAASRRLARDRGRSCLYQRDLHQRQHPAVRHALRLRSGRRHAEVLGHSLRAAHDSYGSEPRRDRATRRGLWPDRTVLLERRQLDRTRHAAARLRARACKARLAQDDGNGLFGGNVRQEPDRQGLFRWRHDSRRRARPQCRCRR